MYFPVVRAPGKEDDSIVVALIKSEIGIGRVFVHPVKGACTCYEMCGQPQAEICMDIFQVQFRNAHTHTAHRNT